MVDNKSSESEPFGEGRSQQGEVQKTPYELIGGETKLDELVTAFYDFMESLPEVSVIRGQHQSDLSEARHKLKYFLSGWLGGPQLYVEKYGHPKLRARHLPFPIGKSERDQWMLCMRKAIAKTNIPDPVNLIMESSLYRLADHMRNLSE